MKSSSAHVASIEAIRAFRRALQQYAESLRDILESQGLEVQRGVDWVREDRRRYWPLQARRAEERLASARTDLELCQLAALKDEKRSCYQEKQLVEQAMARLRHCESQIHVVKHWQHIVEHEAEECCGKMARLTYYLDTVIPQALAALDRMIAALEKYAEPPRTAEPPAP